jgi:predicted MPP superfamily phosphohydrolase
MKIIGFAVFLVVVTLVYGGMNAYAFMKAHGALHFTTRSGVAVALFMACMFVCLFAAHILERGDHFTIAKILFLAAYVWIGLLFLFFCASLVVDLYRLVVCLAGLAAGRALTGAMPSPKLAFYLPLVVALGANLYGYFEGRALRVERLTIETGKLPEDVDRVRIVQITDVHLGPVVSGRRAEAIFSLVGSLEPHILVSTGDLVDSARCDRHCFVEPLASIEAPLGKYAVTGNHEFYAGLEEALAFTREAGFTVLRGEGVSAGGAVNLAGVDDSADGRYGAEAPVSAREALSGLTPGRYTILLKHRPDVEKDALGLFDLQLSGHTHKGQIFPFMLLTRLVYIVDAGWVDLGRGSCLYVSRGTGLWGPPIRVLAPPEVTVIDLVRKAD